MARSNLQLQMAHSPVLRYGLAVFSFAIALGLALLAQRYNFRNVEVPLLLFAVAVTAWYAGPGPAAVTVVLSIAFFDFFFTEPRYSFYISASDLPYLIVFISFAFLVAWFSAVRRRVERELIQARDHLQIEVAERTQQASLLNLTHDTIFVRDMRDIITYWNRGAHELFGWTPEEAIGKRSHDRNPCRYLVRFTPQRDESVCWNSGFRARGDWHFSPQFVEEVFEEDQVVLRLLGFLAFGRHERGDAFAVRPNPHDNPTLICLGSTKVQNLK
jgi:PAS domain-containing protein